MSASIQYFLVAQDKNTNHFEVVKFYPEDYLFSNAKQLEQIDLFTSYFADEEDLVKYLYEKKRVSSCNMNLSIAFVKSRGLKFYEVLYQQSNNSDYSYLLNIAESFLGHSDNPYYRKAQTIIKNFCKKIERDDFLYDMVTSDMTNIYGRFLDYFKTKGRYDGISGLMQQDGEWYCRSYVLLRNILDTEICYQNLMKMPGDFLDNVVSNHKKIERKRLKGKTELLDQLLDQVYPNVVPGQISLFDFGRNSSIVTSVAPNGSIDKVELEKIKANCLKSVKTKKHKRAILPDYSMLDDIMKQNYIFDTLEKIPQGAFYLSKDEKAEFNFNIFSYPVEEENRSALQHFLDSTTQLHFYLYALFSNRWKEAKENGEFYRSELSDDLYYERKKLKKRFSKSKNALNRAYGWCVVYRDCVLKNFDYEIKNGEDFGKVYQKH